MYLIYVEAIYFYLHFFYVLYENKIYVSFFIYFIFKKIETLLFLNRNSLLIKKFATYFDFFTDKFCSLLKEYIKFCKKSKKVKYYKKSIYDKVGFVCIC